MFRSLRFRLPALFFAGIVLTGVLAVAIAFGLFQDYTQDQAREELRQEAAGLTQLYVDQANKTQAQNKPPPFFAAKSLEAASGDRLDVDSAVLLEVHELIPDGPPPWVVPPTPAD